RAIARLKARETDRRKDWAEKASTGIARRFDLIMFEDLQIKNMTRSAKGTQQNPGRNVRQKSGLNRSILRSGWGLLVRRLEQKASGRVEKINPAFTSQRCSACGQVDRKSRESQAVFRCTACGYTSNADVNAAKNIAAGHAVTAREGFRDAGPVNREPQPLASLLDVSGWNPRLWAGRMSNPAHLGRGKQAVGPDHQHYDQDAERHHRDQVGAGGQVAAGVAEREPEQQPAGHRADRAVQTAYHRRGEA